MHKRFWNAPLKWKMIYEPLPVMPSMLTSSQLVPELASFRSVNSLIGVKAVIDSILSAVKGTEDI